MKLFVTGVSGYLGGLLCRSLEADRSIERIVGVDLQPPDWSTSKLVFKRHDVRDPAIRDSMAGSDVVFHMAFVLNEIRDKAKTHDININGSKNVFHSCIDAGVPWLVQLSSMAAFGPHPDNPIPLTEDDYPRGHPECYYCYGKAELEHYLGWLSRGNPDLAVTVLRPTVIIGEQIDNTVAWLFRNRFALLPRGHDSYAQYIHEDDFVRAVQVVLEKRALGTYHVTSDDMMKVSEMMKMAGLTAPAVPLRALEAIADIGFRLGISPVSSHWVRMFSESMVGSSEKLKALGWKPSCPTRELFERYIVERLRTCSS
jgi:nucleoside-diphosphate-sugar epimerase